MIKLYTLLIIWHFGTVKLPFSTLTNCCIPCYTLCRPLTFLGSPVSLFLLSLSYIVLQVYTVHQSDIPINVLREVNQAVTTVSGHEEEQSQRARVLLLSSSIPISSFSPKKGVHVCLYIWCPWTTLLINIILLIAHPYVQQFAQTQLLNSQCSSKGTNAIIKLRN